MTRIAFYSGSFDPLTNGHLDILRQSTRLVDEIFVGIGVHPGKASLFSFAERVAFIEETVSSDPVFENTTIRAISFDGLVVDAAKHAGASMIIRGVRDGSDLDYEMQMAGMNGQMAPSVQTVFLPASAGVRPITATLVRQIAGLGGDVSSFVPLVVEKALRDKLT